MVPLFLVAFDLRFSLGTLLSIIRNVKEKTIKIFHLEEVVILLRLLYMKIYLQGLDHDLGFYSPIFEHL